MDLGLKLGAFASLDSGVSVSANSAANGSTKDLSSGTRKPARCRARFALTQTGTTDKADFQARVQFSEDGSNWPDNDQGDAVFTWKAATNGADLTRSQPVTFSPKTRYFRFRFDNFNASDSFSVSAEVAEDYVTDT